MEKKVKINIKNLTIDELANWLSSVNAEKYRVYQISDWLYKKNVDSFMEMTNIPKSLKELLEDNFSIRALSHLGTEVSKDGTKKFIFKTLRDGEIVETVLIPNENKLTICISTQIGCRMGCKFCLTGHDGFKRNLDTSEIIDQVLMVEKIENVKPTNIVIMGMGEPLDNWENVKKTLIKLTNEKECNFSTRRITLSTVGIIPTLLNLLKEFPQLPLAVSLNAGTTETRLNIMPIEKIHPMKEVVKIIKENKKPTRKAVTFEYVIIKDVNDSIEEAEEVAKLLRGIKCKINIIPLNEWPGLPLRRPDEKTITRFQEKLIEKGFSVFIRKSRGQDISGACGQLRWKYSHKER